VFSKRISVSMVPVVDAVELAVVAVTGVAVTAVVVLGV
jgi:hypothetical protein